MTLDKRTHQDIQQFLNRAHLKSVTTHLDSLIDGYIITAQAENLSVNYIESVVRAVDYFNRFLLEQGFPNDLMDITPQMLELYFIYLKNKPCYAGHPNTPQQDRVLSGHSVNAYARGLQSFFVWAEREGFIEDNPIRKIRIPKAPKKLMPVFQEHQLRDLFAAVDTSTPTGFRNIAMMECLLDTGDRCGEMTTITLADLDLESRQIKIWGKGSKERFVPIGARLVKRLWKYIHVHRPEPFFPRQDRLFLTRNGRPVTVDRVEAIIHYIGAKAGITGVRCSPHTFRHTFAVTFLRNGGDLFTLQRIMGHETLEILRQYVNLAMEDIGRVHRQCSPLDNLDLGPNKLRKYRSK